MRALNNPGAWWGWHGWHNRPQPMSIVELIAAGSMTPQLAALLWVMLERGSSIIVSSMPRNAGKTTTLTALLSFLPEDTRAYFSGGQDEAFDVPPPEPGVATYLLVNELSDHLPIYTWGEAALRAFALLDGGYALAATMHADDAAQTIAQLERGLGATPRQLAAGLDIVLSLRARVAGSAVERHVSEIAVVLAAGEGYAIDVLGARGPAGDTLSLREDAVAVVAGKLGLPVAAVRRELAARVALIESLLARGITEQDDVEAALRAFGERREPHAIHEGGTT